jgi:hypothetical protein
MGGQIMITIKPNTKDRRKLKALLAMADKMLNYYQTLNRETKHHLCNDFTNETELQIRQFRQNIKDTIWEVENGTN